MKKVYFLIMLLLVTFAMADRFVLPADFDNMLEEKKSHGKIKIINSGTAIWSDNTYTIGGKDLHYRCAYQKKIICAPSGSEVLAEVGISKLIAPDGKVTTNYQTDIKVEDEGTYYKICVASFGGLMIDDITLDTEVVDEYVTEVTLNYEPNSADLSAFFYFFTDISPVEDSGDESSFIEIDHQQVCR